MTRAAIGVATLILLLIRTAAAAAAAPSQPNAQDLKQLTLEQLMNVDVTLTARRAEPLATTPAAVSVVTNEDIRRSGVTTVADAVALADGLHTARFNNGTWSTTARGFNAVAANKMLVMVDGRTVYSPLFSGVFWNAIDYTLEDIERIEVVRGPGATLWGANAVNGVINIITRSARDSAGTYLQFGGGNEDPVLADVRFGSASGKTAYRAYAKYVVRASQVFSDGTSADDRRQRAQGGFRLDRGDARTSLMVKGDLFASSNSFPDRDDGEFTVGDLQARWSKTTSPRSTVQLQSYVNHEYRRIPLQLTHRLTTFDFDAQQTWTLDRHGLVWGGGVRVNHDSTTPSAVLSFEPAQRTYPVVNGYIQDDVAVVPKRVYLTPGIKIGANAFSGAEVQPGLRARLLLPRQQMLWGSVARAIRRPTRFDVDIVATTPSGIVLARGNEQFEPERLLASELGYRLLAGRVTADVTVFAHSYDRLRSQEAPASGGIPITVGNSLNGDSHGVELSATLQPASWWRSHLSYVGQRVTMSKDAGSRDVGGGLSEANDPAHQFAFTNSFDVTRHVQADLHLRAVGALPHPVVPRYTELNLRLAWLPSGRYEFALAGQDLLHASHPEFNPSSRGFEEFQRSVRLTATVRLP